VTDIESARHGSRLQSYIVRPIGVAARTVPWVSLRWTKPTTIVWIKCHLRLATPVALRPAILTALLSWSAMLTLTACTHTYGNTSVPRGKSDRTQLSIGYSLLYQEAVGIPKLQWLLMFKEKNEKMSQITKDLITFYEQLAQTMLRMSHQIPAMRIDAATMSDIESETRKAIGVDTAKDFAPLVGKTGTTFEREALLMLQNALNEQRHLTGVMLERESNPRLKAFLDTTQSELNTRYASVGELLNRRYFTHDR
jgi:hypothetical protein